MNAIYLETARVLVQVAPIVFQRGEFALKGGTAINFFLRDMPRLSVDLDLVLPDHTLSREQALLRIRGALEESAAKLRAQGFNVKLASTDQATETKIFARRGGIEIKVEVNLVLRGVVHPVTSRSLVPRAQDTLRAEIEVPVASLEDVYAGKLVAAMDRQHPRDLYDVMQLYEHEGITPAIRHAFVIYLASHHRPIHEVLAPAQRDLSLDYHRAFSGMTAEVIALEQLQEVRERMISDLQRGLDEDEREFLLSLANAAPEWDRLDIAHAAELPALRWKLRNLEQLSRQNPKKFQAQIRSLEALLERGAG
ncbi:MAG: nucleotidyl transferase AbiEii/AbiGii toxin family protein [Pseudomonadota bacterium]|nr:nucleotidyl transferase AbiEii/AbiGii toxin family protein [Pseudomonadota bacterium]